MHRQTWLLDWKYCSPEIENNLYRALTWWNDPTNVHLADEEAERRPLPIQSHPALPVRHQLPCQLDDPSFCSYVHQGYSSFFRWHWHARVLNENSLKTCIRPEIASSLKWPYNLHHEPMRGWTSLRQQHISAQKLQINKIDAKIRLVKQDGRAPPQSISRPEIHFLRFWAWKEPLDVWRHQLDRLPWALQTIWHSNPLLHVYWWQPVQAWWRHDLVPRPQERASEPSLLESIRRL